MTNGSDRRLTAALMIGALAWAAPSAAALTVLVPAKLAAIAPESKVELLAAVTIAGSIAALIAAVGFGALSDLTRSRWGSRAPWMVTGGVLAAASLLLLSTTDGFGLTLVAWVAFQAAMNALIAPLKALLADRVESARLGRVSALYGAATLVGFALGAVGGSVFVNDPASGLRFGAVVIAILPVVSVALARETSTIGMPRQGRVARVILPPRGAPDFYWALGGRFGVMLGSSMITTFQLYILTDYAALDLDEAGRIVGTGAVLTIGASILGSLVSGAISDHIGRRKPLVIAAALLIAAAMLVPLFLPTGGAMLVFAVLAGCGMGVYYAVDVALMAEVLPDGSSRSRDLGILNISNTGGQALGPGLSSLVIAAGLGFAPVFVVAIVITVAGGLSTRFIRSVK